MQTPTSTRSSSNARLGSAEEPSRIAVSVRAFLRNWLLAFLVPRPVVGILYLPRYWRDWRRFQALARQRLTWHDAHPCLGDWVTAAPLDPNYFFQGGCLFEFAKEE
jgi:hypothetical protein